MSRSLRSSSARALGSVLGALGLASCAPLTFSNEGAIDFELYRSVHVSVSAPVVDPGSDYARSYLVDELRKNSGFTLVTTDAAMAVDLNLTVGVTVVEEFPDDVAASEGGVELVDADYAGTAAYTARTPAGLDVDSGVEEDTSETPAEAVEDVLDEVAAHYMPPYRL